MSRTVNPTGFRQITPGKCNVCGYDDGWNSDGACRVYCDCQCCYECNEPFDHARDCQADEVYQDFAYGELT